MRPSLFPVPQLICPQRIYKFRLQFFICGHVSNPVMSTILPCDPVKRDVSALTQRLHSSLVTMRLSGSCIIQKSLTIFFFLFSPPETFLCFPGLSVHSLEQRANNPFTFETRCSKICHFSDASLAVLIGQR